MTGSKSCKVDSADQRQQFLLLLNIEWKWILRWMNMKWQEEKLSVWILGIHASNHYTLMSSMKVTNRPQGCGWLTISRSNNTLFICSWMISCNAQNHCISAKPKINRGAKAYTPVTSFILVRTIHNGIMQLTNMVPRYGHRYGDRTYDTVILEI